MRTSEEALPLLRGLALLLNILSIFSGGRSGGYTGRASNPSLQKYIPVGLFGSAWNGGALFASVYRYRRAAEQQQKQKED